MTVLSYDRGVTWGSLEAPQVKDESKLSLDRILSTE